MKYTEYLVNSFYSSDHTGSISSADITQKVINKETGDAVKIYMVIRNGIIEDAKFQACGSVVLFASLSAIMDIIIGKPLEEALAVNEKLVIREIKQVNRCDYAMVSFAVSALNLTINSYIKKLNKLGIENMVSKKPRVRSFKTSNQITIFNDGRSVTDDIEEMIEASKDEKREEVKEQETELEPEAIAEFDVIEEDDETSVEQNQSAEVFESVPTKIEVRILEEELKTEKAEESINEDLEDSKSTEKNEDVIDEIDSITAKLTDAITKLNFKFDVDDDSTEE